MPKSTTNCRIGNRHLKNLGAHSSSQCTLISQQKNLYTLYSVQFLQHFMHIWSVQCAMFSAHRTQTETKNSKNHLNEIFTGKIFRCSIHWMKMNIGKISRKFAHIKFSGAEIRNIRNNHWCAQCQRRKQCINLFRAFRIPATFYCFLAFMWMEFIFRYLLYHFPH